MKTYPGSFYTWMVVILAHIGLAINIVVMFIGDNICAEHSRYCDYGDGAYVFFIFILIALPFLSIIPVLIARSSYNEKNYIGYGLPILSLLIAIPFFISASICTGKFCGVVPSLIGFGFGLLAVIWPFFYIVEKLNQRWTVKFTLPVILVGIIIIISCANHILSTIPESVRPYSLPWSEWIIPGAK